MHLDVNWEGVLVLCDIVLAGGFGLAFGFWFCYWSYWSFIFDFVCHGFSLVGKKIGDDDFSTPPLISQSDLAVLPVFDDLVWTTLQQLQTTLSQVVVFCTVCIRRLDIALELGVTLARMAESYEFDALIALGAVIRGETYHFELVSNESGAGVTRISLDYGIPIANGILTCETDAQAQARVIEKGRDCARTAVEMANLSIGLTPDDEVEEE